MRDAQKKIKGYSYIARVAKINEIYDRYSRTGLSNREILRRYIYPEFPICERSFYNIVKASAKEKNIQQYKQLTLGL